MMKAIETRFDGCRFRSRLEARWAVFFKAIGIRYEYEKEGYNLSGLNYLPDFWLPWQECFFEIKGEMPDEEEFEKTKRLAQASGYAVYIAIGDIKPFQVEEFEYTNIIGWRRKRDMQHIETGRPDFKKAAPDDVLMGEYAWCECPYCGCFDLAYDFSAEYLPCGCFKKKWDHNSLFDGIKDSDPSTLDVIDWWFEKKLYQLSLTGDSPRLTKAFTAARSARFEFGEKGGR